MTHEACREMLLDLAYGGLAPAEAAEVEAHLAGCEACRAERSRLEGTRALMRQLEPEPPPAHGEHLILTAAREAAERGRRRRALVPGWVWQLSLTAAVVMVAGGVSFYVLSVREGEQRRDIEGRPESFLAKAESPAPPSAPPPRSQPAAEVPRDVERGAAREEPRAPRDVGRGLVPRRSEATTAGAAETPLSPQQEERGRLRDLEPGAHGFAAGASPPASAAPAPKLARAPLAEKKKAVVAQSSGEAAAEPGSPPAPAASPAPEPPATPPPAAAEEPPPPAAPEESAVTPEPEGPPPLLSARTWKKDPRIRAIQKLVREIDEAQRHGKLVESARPFQACGPGEDAERRLYAGLDGRIVKYLRQVGGEGVALTSEQLYGADGRLRYVFIHGGAVNGAVFEHRIWLDQGGQRLWEEERWRRGRYPLPAVWSQKDLALDAPDASALECGAP